MVESGYYQSKVRMNVVKRLDVNVAKEARSNKVERVYGSWSTNTSNIIEFKPNEKVFLSPDDVKLPNIRQLIETGQLTRVY